MNRNISIVTLLFASLFLWSCDLLTTHTERDVNTTEDEIVEVEEEYEADCDECNGTGFAYYSCMSCGGKGDKYHYSSETHPQECYNCFGTGQIRCQRCGANGYIQCEYCAGRGHYRCTVCDGYGCIVFDITDPDTWIRCNNCEGTGYADCLICEGNGRIKCSPTQTCSVCWGSGCYGQENISNSGYLTCSECNGTGKYRSFCKECNGSGTVTKTRIVKKKKSEL